MGRIILLLLLSVGAFAQSPRPLPVYSMYGAHIIAWQPAPIPGYTKINARYQWIAGAFDSTLSVPYGATASLRTLGYNAPGALFFQTSDSSLYAYTGTQWRVVSGGGGWLTTGNSGTVAGTNFIGTTDAVALVVKTNNTERARVLSGGNVGIGTSSPAFKLDVGGTSVITDRMIGINNVQMMYLPDQATFLRSMFIGTGGNFLSHTGGDEGLYNMGIGLNALDSVTTGYVNVALGPESMKRLTTGFYNTAFGSNTLQNNISGDENAAFGLNALKNNTGDFNTAIGTSALLFNTSGQTNTAVGNQALRDNTTGLQNTAIGYRNLQTNTTGYFNTAVAYRALEDNTTGYGLTGIGLHALSNNTTGYYNSAIGFYAGDGTLTGRNSTFAGTYAGAIAGQKVDPIHQTVIGAYAYGTRDFSLVLGSKDSVNVTELNGKDSLIVDATLTTIKSVTSTGTYTGRWKARVGSTTSSGTPTINTDNVDIYKLTAQAADITSFTTNLSGTPNDGDILEIQITGTAARAITWGSSFVSSSVALPTTTVTTTTLTVVVQYFTTSSYGNNKWVCVNSF